MIDVLVTRPLVSMVFRVSHNILLNHLFVGGGVMGAWAAVQKRGTVVQLSVSQMNQMYQDLQT